MTLWYAVSSGDIWNTRSLNYSERFRVETLISRVGPGWLSESVCLEAHIFRVQLHSKMYSRPG